MQDIHPGSKKAPRRSIQMTAYYGIGSTAGVPAWMFDPATSTSWRMTTAPHVGSPRLAPGGSVRRLMGGLLVCMRN